MLRLIRGTDQVTGGNFCLCPRLATEAGGQGVIDSFRNPTGGETVVVNPAGIPSGVQVVGRAHGCNCSQIGRQCASHFELRDAGIRNSNESNFVTKHPTLMTNNLHRVVAVKVRVVSK